MPDVYRAQVLLQGWQGAPGINTLWFTKGDPLGTDQTTAEQIASELETVYEAMRSTWVSGVRATNVSLVDKIEETTGALLARYSVPIWETGAGTSTGGVSRATQAKMQFLTNTIRGNRLLQGGPFIGPLGPGALTTSGALAAATVTQLSEAWGTFLSGLGPRLAVYAQPRGGTGAVGDVVSVGVKALPAVLRSRRD